MVIFAWTSPFQLSEARPVVHSVCPAGGQVVVHGTAWQTKISALMRRLLWLKQHQPQEKCLVFSQFPDALTLLGKALTLNDIKFVQLKSDRKEVSLLRGMRPMSDGVYQPEAVRSILLEAVQRGP
jgi:hypothetical protein